MSIQDKLRIVQEALDECNEHLPEGTYLAAMNALRDLFQLHERQEMAAQWRQQQAQRDAAAAAQREREAAARRAAAPQVVRVAAPPALAAAVRLEEQRRAAAAQRRAAPARGGGRAARKDLQLLTLPDGIAIYCRVNGTVHQATWSQARKTITQNGTAYDSPSGWASALGKHCNGWDHCYTVPNPPLPTQTKTLSAYWTEQH
jgi:hypothetical protein